MMSDELITGSGPLLEGLEEVAPGIRGNDTNLKTGTEGIVIVQRNDGAILQLPSTTAERLDAPATPPLHDRVPSDWVSKEDKQDLIVTTSVPEALMDSKNLSKCSSHSGIAISIANNEHGQRHFAGFFEKSRYFLRSVGLRIIPAELSSRGHGHEETKVVINTTLWVALSRCGVHIVPLLATITLLWFNIHGYFIGANLAGPLSWSDTVKFQMLQFAAKAHELFIIASTATVVFYLIRNQLLFGKGVPLGLLSSGMSFSELGYFWSPEFWGAMSYPASRWIKLQVFGFLITTGIIAASAGPSSAILMIPQNQTWPSGTIGFYLNGTNDDLWPTSLTIAHSGPGCNTSSAISNPSCAAGGYYPLYYHYSVFNSLPPSDAFILDIEDGITKRTLQGNIRNDWQPSSETWTQSPHVATAAIEEPLRQTWSLNLDNIVVPSAWRFKYSDLRTAQVQTQISAVRTICVPFQNLSALDSSLPFPVLSEYDYWYTRTEDPVYGNGLVQLFALGQSFGSIWANITRTSDSLSLRSLWVELPSSFGSATAGLALLIPPDSSSSLGMGISCTIDARWARGLNWATASMSDWAWASFFDPMQSTPSSTRGTGGSDRLFAPADDGNWTRINTTLQYLEAMTPMLPDNSNTTALESILLHSIPNLIYLSNLTDYVSNHSVDLVPFVEHVVSTVVADGIARTGSYLQRPLTDTLLGLTSDPNSVTGIKGPAVEFPDYTTANFTSMYMETMVQGYAYILSVPILQL